MSGAIGRASGLVLMPRFLVILNHSASMNWCKFSSCISLPLLESAFGEGSELFCGFAPGRFPLGMLEIGFLEMNNFVYRKNY